MSRPLSLGMTALTMMLLLGCAPLYPAQIVPEGNGTYLAVQSSASAWLDARVAAIKRAAAYCKQMGQTILVVDSTQERSSDELTANDHASVTFRCEMSDSPH